MSTIGTSDVRRSRVKFGSVLSSHVRPSHNIGRALVLKPSSAPFIWTRRNESMTPVPVGWGPTTLKTPPLNVQLDAAVYRLHPEAEASVVNKRTAVARPTAIVIRRSREPILLITFDTLRCASWLPLEQESVQLS